MTPPRAASPGHGTVARTIVSVAFPLAPVGPNAVGGAEQILTLLDAALTDAGHRSIVIAGAGSTARGTLVSLPPLEATSYTPETRALAHAHVRQALAELLRQHPVDLVHMHGLDFHDYLPPAGPPVLATLHLPPAWYAPPALAPTRPRTYLVCVSRSQRRACPPGTRVTAVIRNGIPVQTLLAPYRRRAFCVALGRICPEKGFHLALDAARAAHAPLLLAGRVFPYESHQRYWATEIHPRLDRLRRFVGPVDVRGKHRLLAAARCLLVPSLAPETSSLVAMEALACGTPVIAFPAGALAEIVEHERTGFLVRDTAEMAEAIHAAHTIDPAVCRRTAAERFASTRMTREYLALYERLVRGPPDAAEGVSWTLVSSSGC